LVKLVKLVKSLFFGRGFFVGSKFSTALNPKNAVNVPAEDKGKLDGVMASDDFREGGVTIVFFTPPKY